MTKEKKYKKQKFLTLEKVVVGLSVGCILISGINLTKSLIISNKNYLKPNKQVERDAEFLDANLEVMKCNKNSNVKEVVRLKHNDNEPIYVTLDNIQNETIKTSIIKSLNYMEDIFSNINSKYRFQIVDTIIAEDKKQSGKTIINYKTSNNLEDNVLGLNESTTNKTELNRLFGSAYTNIYNVESTISINENILLQSFNENQMLYVMLHELLHSFGFEDIYNENISKLTIMDVEYGMLSQIISPNDLKVLYSAYYEDHIKKDAVDYTKLKSIKNKMDIYEKEYYNYIANKIIDEYGFTDIVSIEPLNGYFNCTLNKKSLKFKFYNNKVQVEIYDNNGKIEKTTEGVVQYGEKFIILKNFDIKIPEISQFYFSIYKKSNGLYNIVKINSGAMMQTLITHNKKSEELIQ